MRAKLYRLEARDHALLLNFHHICADGWSMNVLLKDRFGGAAMRHEARK